MKQLLILGAGGLGREVLAWARQSEGHGVDWAIKGFLDDNAQALSGFRTPAPWIGTIRDHQPSEDEVFICAVGNPAIKRRCYEIIEARGGHFISLIHRTAILGDSVELSPGVILCPYSIVSGYSSLGKGVIVNLHASVDHDASVGDWSQINCHCDVTANARIGREVWLSSHVTVAPGVSVGDGAYLGVGAAVLRNVEPGTKVFGVPARRIE
jgi:sugar O-acyltransferase (sialic acid O-acetyltransferase NeuD family)